MMNAPPLKLYNSLTRTQEIFLPRNPPLVSLYCCGPTVYHYQHIGNMRAYLFEDLLVRTLRFHGYSVRHVMNITDVGHLASDADEGEDKMAIAMRREKKRSHEIADHYTSLFFDECAMLNIGRPDVVCKATDHIAEMIAMIEQIIAHGYGYLAEGNVYFDVSKDPTYGQLARLDLNSLQAGARVAVDTAKRNPHDFVLWFTRSKFENQELVWDSPWGRGYPGWHIECSAMATKYLGTEIDIHCGGIDHIPVHHTNEIAQTEAATGIRPWVSLWMHNEHLVINKAKMSKSTGGFLTVAELVAKGIEPLAYRYFCLGGHYRTQLNFSWDAVENAARSLMSLRRQVEQIREEARSSHGSLDDGELASYRDEFAKALFDDLNSPQALAVVWKVIQADELRAEQKIALLEDYDHCLGLGIATWEPTALDIPAEVTALVEERECARREKNWARSDELRGEILQRGFVVEDSPSGAKIKRG